jgi:adenylate cyclase
MFGEREDALTMADVFLSYASEDQARVIPLIEALEGAGLSVWWDRELIAGPEYTDAIQAALEEASCIVVLWSEHSVNSIWVRDEAQEGRQRNCLVPCLIDDVRPPLGFRSLQTVSMADWPSNRDELPRVVDGIRHVMASPQTSLTLSAGPTHVPPASQRSIAVLPFNNLSTDAEQQFFCDGLVEDITTELSNIRLLLVISRNSSFSYRDDDIKRVSRDLGVYHVLTGSVRRSGDRMRVSARLVEGRTGRTIWSKRYDRDVIDLFDLQDDLTREIVTALDVSLATGDMARRIQKHRNIEAREVLYRGMFEYRKFEKSANAEARHLFQQFIEAEPHSVEGYSWLLLTYSFAIVVGWDAPQDALPRLAEWVSRAMEIDPEDGQTLVSDGIYRVLAGDLDGAYRSLNRAVELEPNLDDAWFFRGWCLMFMGESDAAIDSLTRAMRLSPVPNSVRFGVLGTAQRNAGRYEDSVAAFKECLKLFPEFLYAHTSLAIVYHMMGDHDAAAREVELTLEMDPTYTVQRFVTPDMYTDSSFMARNAEALRAAGLPEG